MIHEKLPSLGSFSIALVATIATSASLSAQTCPDPAALTADHDGAMAHVRYLSDDQLEGRAVGTPGARCAADYLADQFRELGLEPAGTEGNYFQAFPIRNGAEIGRGNFLSVAETLMRIGADWLPLGFSATDRLEGELVYAGHGLSSPGNPEDQYARMDVSGKVVVVEWGDPDDAHGVSLRGTPHFKATVMAGRDAAGLLILAPDGMGRPMLENDDRAFLDIPVGIISPPRVPHVRVAAQDAGPVRWGTEVNPVIVDAQNVAALLPGSDPELRDEYVIVGAHYDHLGFGGEGSLDPDSREIHNGADDNASGTAAVVEIARALANGPRLDRSVLFLAFTGEERGLWGSQFFVREPTVDLGSTVAMLNLDMVGRVVNDNLTVFGFGTADEWDAIVDGANATIDRPMSIAKAPDGFGPSDHSSFHGEGLPVLHFFSGTHMDYHRPSDDWGKVNVEGLERVIELTTAVTRTLADGGETDGLTAIQMVQEHPTTTSGDSSSSGGGYGAYLGTIPDMSPRTGGLRLTGVREGSPAEEAGLQAGDLVVEFDGKEVTDIYTYTYALQARDVGDEVVIVVHREGRVVTVRATLGQRR